MKYEGLSHLKIWLWISWSLFCPINKNKTLLKKMIFFSFPDESDPGNGSTRPGRRLHAHAVSWQHDLGNFVATAAEQPHRQGHRYPAAFIFRTRESRPDRDQRVPWTSTFVRPGSHDYWIHGDYKVRANKGNLIRYDIDSDIVIQL